MIRGFYTALSGVVAALQRQAAVADDVANVSTVGYKRSATEQSDFKLAIARSGGGTIGALGTGTVAGAPQIDVSQGAITATYRMTDLAIEGDGLFVVRTPDGLAYTRAGNFALDQNGRLVTQQGYPVVDTAGRDIIASGEFWVSEDGTVTGTGQRFAVAAWPAGGARRMGENLYAFDGAPRPATGRILQGAVEVSNVDMATSMTDLITLQRSFQLSARALSIQEGSIEESTRLGLFR